LPCTLESTRTGIPPWSMPCAAPLEPNAEPKKQALGVEGDAAFQIDCQETATARENAISFVVCVGNDMSLSAIHSAQVLSYGGRAYGTEFKVNVNTASAAEAFGGAGQKVDDPKAISSALDKALSSRVPYVIDIVVDTEENPIFN